MGDIRIGDVIRSDDSDVWLEVEEIGQHLPQRREGTAPGDDDESLTAHFFRGHMIDSSGGRGDRHLFNYRDDLLITRRR